MVLTRGQAARLAALAASSQPMANTDEITAKVPDVSDPVPPSATQQLQQLLEMQLRFEATLSQLTTRMDKIQAIQAGDTPPSSRASVTVDASPVDADIPADLDSEELKVLYRLLQANKDKKVDVKPPKVYNGKRDKNFGFAELSRAFEGVL